MSQNFHCYHIVDPRPWPLLARISTLCTVTGLLTLLVEKDFRLFLIRFFILATVSFQWWRDISQEATLQGWHTSKVQTRIRWGILLFIISEVLFFFRFFWAFFHSSLTPILELGLKWPPSGISPFNPFSVPLLNTVILLSSGVTVTWRHHAITSRFYYESIVGLSLTILLGIYFTRVQALEYTDSRFRISDRIYGSCFFVATGFHGLHVLIGTIFLLFSLLRIMSGHFSPVHHFGFEASAWYWHFVDVVWVFLFISIYWWGR